jgi:hypothetical protein
MDKEEEILKLIKNQNRKNSNKFDSTENKKQIKTINKTINKVNPENLNKKTYHLNNVDT